MIALAEDPTAGKAQSEASVFLACLGAVNQLRSLAAAFGEGEITRKAFSKQATPIVADLCLLAEKTEAFDVVAPVVEFGRCSPCFWRWFNWWSDHAATLTTRQIKRMDSHRPPGDWLRHRNTPAFALVII